MLKKEDAIRIEIEQYGNTLRNGKLRIQKVYIYSCIDCKSMIKSQSQHLPKHSGKCVSCAQFNLPYMPIYNELIKTNKRRNVEINITYDNFIELIKNDKCHYCFKKLIWNKHSKIKGKAVSRAYQLDRKNNDEGYLLNNVVTCCFRCNAAKSDKYTYEDWYGMTKYFRDKYEK